MTSQENLKQFVKDVADSEKVKITVFYHTDQGGTNLCDYFAPTPVFVDKDNLVIREPIYNMSFDLNKQVIKKIKEIPDNNQVMYEVIGAGQPYRWSLELYK